MNGASRLFLGALAVMVCAPATHGAAQAPGTSSTAARAQVRPGLELFLEQPPDFVVGKRIGLITNHSAIDREGRSAIDLLSAHPALKLVALFSPEHGIRGTADSRVESGRDEKTGLPIHSLYGATNKPTAEMLEGVDVLVFDIEDVGVRQYTYESTMTLAMEAAAAKGIPFVVLDRPNPITGTILEGNVLEGGRESFVGIHTVLSRHGMTMGELARLYNAERKLNAQLHVVPVTGWTRSLWRDQTGLPWVKPSPNLYSLGGVTSYPGTVFFEAVNVAEGRGSDAPFEQIGAPWLDHQRLARELNALNLPGVRFEPLEFRIADTGRKYAGELVKGVRFVVTDRESYRPITASLLTIEKIRQLHPDRFEWRCNAETNLCTIERHGGTAKLRAAIEAGTTAMLLQEWERDIAAFRERRAPYLLYR